MNEQFNFDEGAATLRFQVMDDDEGLRLDAFLVKHCPKISRNRIQGDLQEGRVQVEGRQRPKGFKLKIGSLVEYEPGGVREMVAIPQDIPLDIIFQDEDILILNKPVGMVVHPAVGHPDGTVVNALLHHCHSLQAGDDPLRPGIVHRLDRDTSGLLVVALNDQAHAHLAEQLRTRSLGRTYLALSWGSWKEHEGTLTGDIGRHAKLRQKKAVVSQGGRSATTGYRVLEDYGFVQLCEVKLETGRTHQIRVHFAHFHHPVVGDQMYGQDIRGKAVHALDRTLAAQMVQRAKRQMLHAFRLDLEHPVSGDRMSFEAPIPPDMQHVLTLFREQE